MAVSKIAVMALVGILAVPILLGYAFNLNETTVTDYKPEGESVNVTELLQNGSAYHYTHADPYTLNTNFYLINNQTQSKIIPEYQTISAQKSTYPLKQEFYQNVSWGYQVFNMDNSLDYYYIEFTPAGGVTMEIFVNGGGSTYHSAVHSFYTDNKGTFQLTRYSNDEYIVESFNGVVPKFAVAGSAQQVYLAYSSDSNYVDLSGGFKLYGLYNIVGMPNETKSVTFTVDLSTMNVDHSRVWFASVNGGGNSNTPAFFIEKNSDGTYFMRINSFNSPNPQTVLYTDPTRSENVYQFTISKEYMGSFDDNGITRYRWNNYVSADYVGNWPTIIGKANSFWHFEYQEIHNQSIDDYIGGVKINVQNTDLSPKIRFDDAYYNGFAYAIVEDQTYNPSNFKTNPTTTISNVQKFGYSLEFGGNSYQVDSTGNITLGTHKISVNGLKLESIPVPVGYENKINGNVVSVTAQPSDIKFIGQWGASISTVGNSATTVTKTEWTAGSFAWDGMDTNFLIVGLITCLGVFIGLGIYARKTGKGVIPLLIVCGGAAALFICMI